MSESFASVKEEVIECSEDIGNKDDGIKTDISEEDWRKLWGSESLWVKKVNDQKRSIANNNAIDIKQDLIEKNYAKIKCKCCNRGQKIHSIH